MNLITYLEQSNLERQGLGLDRAGPQRREYFVGPSDVAKWAQANKAECSRGDKNTELVGLMFRDLTRAGLASEFRLKFTGTGNYAQPFQSPATLAEALWHCEDSEPALPYLEPTRVAVRAMVGFGCGMSDWAWPACRHYYTASTNEVREGVTMDFATKHLNTNADIRGARKVAQVRGAPVNQRQGIAAFGNIVTSRSGGIVKEEVAAFCREILGRQKEFTDTHQALSDYFRTHLGDFSGGRRAAFHLIDSVNFMTKNKYSMHEFEDGSGAEVECYIRFSVSCNAAGDQWAVHHLSGTSELRTPPNGATLASVGIGGMDATTTASFG
jgi:hypothetical protein